MRMRLIIKEETGEVLFCVRKHIEYQDLTHSWCMQYVWNNLKEINEYEYEECDNYTDYISGLKLQNDVTYIGEFTGLQLITFLTLFKHDIKASQYSHIYIEVLSAIEYVHILDKCDDLFEVIIEWE